MDKKHCEGCYNDCYNSVPGGCWNLKSAKLVWRILVGNGEPPPYINKKKVRVPNCYLEEEFKTHYIDPASLTSTGYWR